MGRIIFSIVSLVVLAVIIVMNAGTFTTFNLLGWQFAQVPIIAIAIVAFVVGALYSFIFYASGYLARRRKKKITSRKQQLKTQEQSIKDKDAQVKTREKEVEARASESTKRELPPPSDAAAPASLPDRATKRRKGGGRWFGNLIGKR